MAILGYSALAFFLIVISLASLLVLVDSKLWYNIKSKTRRNELNQIGDLTKEIEYLNFKIVKNETENKDKIDIAYQILENNRKEFKQKIELLELENKKLTNQSSDLMVLNAKLREINLELLKDKR